MAYDEAIRVGEVDVTFVPAGHVLGSAQIVLEHRVRKWWYRVTISAGPIRPAPPFVPVPCDVFITEATFGLPVFRHPDTGSRSTGCSNACTATRAAAYWSAPMPSARLSASSRELRARGHEQPIYFHGAIERLNQLYESFGVDLASFATRDGATKAEMAGHVVIAPPGALNDRWSRRLPDPVTAMASGWMRIRQRARQRNVELPLIISDHADWDELTMTIRELEPREVWITHGREEALKHWCMTHQIKACELNLVGYEDEDE